MHIGRVTRSRSKFVAMIVDEGLVGSSSSTTRRGRGYVRSHACARELQTCTRRIITRQTTTEACNAEIW